MRALLLQVCAAAAAGAGLPGCEPALAGSLRGVLEALLRCSGAAGPVAWEGALAADLVRGRGWGVLACTLSIAPLRFVVSACAFFQPLAPPCARLQDKAHEAAGSVLDHREAALALLPCANVACCNVGGGSDAALYSRRCSGCKTARFCSVHCSHQAWAAEHRRACRQLAAMAARDITGGADAAAGPRERPACPVCLALFAALGHAGSAEQQHAHVEACLQQRRDRLQARQNEFDGDPGAAAAALPERCTP